MPPSPVSSPEGVAGLWRGVAGHVKPQALNAIEQQGPFKINGDPTIMKLMDELLQSFIEDNRMKIDQQHYKPCYEIIA